MRLVGLAEMIGEGGETTQASLLHNRGSSFFAVAVALILRRATKPRHERLCKEYLVLPTYH